MREERRIVVEGIPYVVVISDEKEALLAAKADGRALIGFETRPGLDLGPAPYVAQSWDALEEPFLEQVVRRAYGLPWRIADTERLFVREFQAGDEKQVLREETDTEADKVFQAAQSLSRYIECQYGFYGYGLWALVEKATGRLVGKAGISQAAPAEAAPELWEEAASNLPAEAALASQVETAQRLLAETALKFPAEAAPTPQACLCLELGYHIFGPYRHKGYAKEACGGILALLEENAPRPYCVYAKIDASNKASIQVALGCGLRLINQKYSVAGPRLCLYAGCWK